MTYVVIAYGISHIDNSYYSWMVWGKYLFTIAQIQYLREKAAFFIMSKLPQEVTNWCFNMFLLFDPLLVPFFVTDQEKTCHSSQHPPYKETGQRWWSCCWVCFLEEVTAHISRSTVVVVVVVVAVVLVVVVVVMRLKLTWRNTSQILSLATWMLWSSTAWKRCASIKDWDGWNKAHGSIYE